MAELWDAYDVDFNKIENVTLVKGEEVPNGMYHLVCEVIVKHKDGTYLLMKRDPNKALGGKWEMSAGGSAIKGETPIECITRELYEETGIAETHFEDVELITHQGYRTHFAVFKCETGCNKDSIALQKGETVGYKWADRKTVAEMFPASFAFPKLVELALSSDI